MPAAGQLSLVRACYTAQYWAMHTDKSVCMVEVMLELVMWMHVRDAAHTLQDAARALLEYVVLLCVCSL